MAGMSSRLARSTASTSGRESTAKSAAIGNQVVITLASMGMRSNECKRPIWWVKPFVSLCVFLRRTQEDMAGVDRGLRRTQWTFSGLCPVVGLPSVRRKLLSCRDYLLAVDSFSSTASGVPQLYRQPDPTDVQARSRRTATGPSEGPNPPPPRPPSAACRTRLPGLEA